MWWNNRQPFVPPAFLDRVRLRHAALRYAEHGWAVTPGACLAGHRFVCGRPGCPTTGCHPALEGWEESATTSVARVIAWWRDRPHTILLATGAAFDVLEVPAALGLRALSTARLHAGVAGPGRTDLSGPVAVTPTGRWMFLVRAGARRCGELDERLDVVHHGRGSWIPAAPSRMPEGRVRWAISPEQVGWRLPEAGPVQNMLLDALGALGRRKRPVRAAVPRQVSTARRAA
jgi:Bifunctional DNA primase/polymerase, N-terminal